VSASLGERQTRAGTSGEQKSRTSVSSFESVRQLPDPWLKFLLPESAPGPALPAGFFATDSHGRNTDKEMPEIEEEHPGRDTTERIMSGVEDKRFVFFHPSGSCRIRGLTSSPNEFKWRELLRRFNC
jgi:hypothetical protein